MLRSAAAAAQNFHSHQPYQSDSGRTEHGTRHGSRSRLGSGARWHGDDAVTPVQGQQRVAPAELEARLRAIGPERYHHRHPFHLLMHEGKLTRGQLQAWALNRYYYQSIIPLKDAIIVSRTAAAAFRRALRTPIINHDAGGIPPA